MLLFSHIAGMARSKKHQKPKQLKIDESLFERIGQDDAEAFEELYHITERTMYAYILSVIKNHDDALDVMQDTYLKIRAAAHLYKPMGKPLAWMFTIARNLCMTKLRRKQRFSDSENLEMENSLTFSYIEDPEDKFVLESALLILTEEEREIVLLHAVSGMKHKEIAANLGLPLSTTLSKYRRALKKLREHLKKEGLA